MDFFKLLKDEHKEAKTILKELTEQDSIDRREAEKLCTKLRLHMEMEEKYFYPRMEEVKKAQEETQEAELEHKEAKKLIDAIMDKDLDEVEYKVKIEMLQLAITHHADEEEEELFPLAKKALSKEEIEEITEKMQALKEKKAPARV